MHPRQEHLLKLVHERPGISFRALVRTSGIPAGCVRHHLNRLKKRGQIWDQMVGPTLAHFYGQRPMDPDVVHHTCRKALPPTFRPVLLYVKANGEVCQKDVQAAFGGYPRATTQHRLKRLVDLGFLQVRLQGRYKFYS